MMMHRINPARWLILVVVCAWMAISPAGSALAAGQSAQDQVVLAGLRASDGSSTPAGTQVRFDALVNYQLQSTPRAFLLLLVFEDNAKTASQSVANAKWVGAGSSQTELSLTYQPRPTTKTMVVFAGLFKPDKSLIAFSTTRPFAAQPSPGRSLFDAAMLARRAGEYSIAVADLTNAIGEAPNNGNYYYWRAQNLADLGQYDRAIADYNRALAIFPGNRATRVGRAIARMWKGEWDQAIVELTRVIDESSTPDRWTVWALRARGVAHAAAGEISPAIADYERYAALTSDQSDRARVENWVSDLNP